MRSEDQNRQNPDKSSLRRNQVSAFNIEKLQAETIDENGFRMRPFPTDLTQKITKKENEWKLTVEFSKEGRQLSVA